MSRKRMEFADLLIVFRVCLVFVPILVPTPGTTSPHRTLLARGSFAMVATDDSSSVHLALMR